MLIDSTPLHRSGGLIVLRHAPSVVWPDGSQLPLHLMQFGDTPALLLRGLQVDGQWAALDLRAATPDLADDILNHHHRDAQGLIWFTFRNRWWGANACVAALRPHLRHLPGPTAATAPLPQRVDGLARAAA